MANYSKSPQESLTRALKLLKKAISLNANYSFAHALLGHIFGMMGQFDRALAEGKLAVSLNPNSDRAMVWLAMTFNWVGKPQEAIALYKKAMRLSPFPPSYYYSNLGGAYAQMGLYSEAISEYKKSLQLTPQNVIVLAALTGCYSMSGQQEEAKATAANLLSINPKFSAKIFVMRLPNKDKEYKKRLYDALLKANLK